MTHRAGLKHTRKQGRPYKYLSLSYDQSSERAFYVIGRYAQDVMNKWEEMTMEEKAKAVQTLSPTALKRIPEKSEAVNLNLSITDNQATEMLERAERNLLIYKKLHDRKSAESGVKSEMNTEVNSTGVN